METCICPDIDVTAPGEPRTTLKGLDWDCSACVEVTESANGEKVWLVKPHVDQRSRYMHYTNVAVASALGVETAAVGGPSNEDPDIKIGLGHD